MPHNNTILKRTSWQK